MESVSPVFTEAEVAFERVLALDQPQYLPIVVLPITVEVVNSSENVMVTAEGPVEPGEKYLKLDWGMSIRLRLSEEERAMIMAGADIVITEVLFGAKFTPLNLQLCKPDERPEF